MCGELGPDMSALERNYGFAERVCPESVCYDTDPLSGVSKNKVDLRPRQPALPKR